MGAHLAAHATHRRRIKEQQDREEEMSQFTGADLDRYEFKIMRSPNNQFRNPAGLTQMLAEEQVHGWALMEKLDDGRVRLMRERNARRLPTPSGSDPYRTQYGGSALGTKLLILSLIAGVLLLTVGLLFSVNGMEIVTEETLITGFIGILVIFLGIAAAIVARTR